MRTRAEGSSAVGVAPVAPATEADPNLGVPRHPFGPVRVGDVELAKVLVDPALLGGTDDAITHTLTRLADEVPLDLPGFTHALASLTGPGDPAASSVEGDTNIP